jgi:type IV secretion system protein VirB9
MQRLILFFVLLFFSFEKYSQALEFESPIPIDSRIKIFIYNPNEFFAVKFSPSFKSMVRFQKDEQIQLISIGDPMSWKLENIDNNLLFISPIESGVKTNMTIITNKRTYLLDISSAESGEEDEDIAYIVKFYYPELNPDTPFKKKILKAKVGVPSTQLQEDKNLEEKLEDVSFEGGSKSNLALNFKYSYAGADADLVPMKIFDNGVKTFFQFKGKGSPPSIFIVKKGKEFKAKIDVQGSHIAVGGVHEQFTLREGTKLICVFNTNLIKKEDLSSEK